MLKEFSVKNKQLLSEFIAKQTDRGYYRIQKIIKTKSVKINGVRVGADQDVNPHDVVSVYMPEPKKADVDVVYRDENILVANKPAGIEVVGENSLTTSVNNMLENVTAVPVHRLDRNTLGLVVFALNKTAEEELLATFKDKGIDKTYSCIVVGTPKQASAKLKAYLFKDADKSLVYISDTPRQGYRPIETHYTLIKRLGELALLKVKPITGRTHQIRAHLAHINLPILGDGKYGINKVNTRYHVKTQLLCCTSITFHFAGGALKYLDNKTIDLSVDLTKLYN